MISAAPTPYLPAATVSAGNTTKDNVEFMLQQTEAATNYLSNTLKMCSTLPWPLNTHPTQNPLHHHHQLGSNVAAAAAAAALAGHHHNIESILGGYKSNLDNGQSTVNGNHQKFNYNNNNNNSYDGESFKVYLKSFKALYTLIIKLKIQTMTNCLTQALTIRVIAWTRTRMTKITEAVAATAATRKTARSRMATAKRAVTIIKITTAVAVRRKTSIAATAPRSPRFNCTN